MHKEAVLVNDVFHPLPCWINIGNNLGPKLYENILRLICQAIGLKSSIPVGNDNNCYTVKLEMNKFEWYVPRKPIEYDAEGMPLPEVLTEEERIERDCLKVTNLPLLKVPHDDKSILHKIEKCYQNA